ncbi:MAG: hypothetical protein P8X55_08610 [Desulfosarcinaceae bacterium]
MNKNTAIKDIIYLISSATMHGSPYVHAGGEFTREDIEALAYGEIFAGFGSAMPDRFNRL